MREIKFRGKRVDNGEWEIGDLMQNYIHHQGFLTIVQNGCIYNKIISETVGQFTGLLDKNGVEIYEGDIITCEIYSHENYEEYLSETPITIEFSNGTFYPFGYKFGWRSSVENIEVKGNIYENPELIK